MEPRTGDGYRTKLAVLIDAENVSARHFLEVVRRAQMVGEPLVQQAFGDFSEGKLTDWAKIAREAGVSLVFQTSAGKGKNSTDMAMTIAAMDLLHERVVDAFFLVSSDCDFIPLATRLRRAGREVYGMGEAKTDNALRNVCSAFFVLEPQAKPVVRAIPNHPEPAGGTALQAAVAKTIRAISCEGIAPGWMPPTTLKKLMADRAPELKSSLNGKFLKALKNTGLIEEMGAGSSIQVRIARGSG